MKPACIFSHNLASCILSHTEQSNKRTLIYCLLSLFGYNDYVATDYLPIKLKLSYFMTKWSQLHHCIKGRAFWNSLVALLNPASDLSASINGFLSQSTFDHVYLV